MAYSFIEKGFFCRILFRKRYRAVMATAQMPELAGESGVYLLQELFRSNNHKHHWPAVEYL